ncbi:MAG TPA: hypothetical protein ENK99_02010 [Campylobacterales bacterium]|nr:hypothetical protein [Campylobacterales bacterium]
MVFFKKIKSKFSNIKAHLKKNSELSSTFDNFLNIQENSDTYRNFVAQEYQKQNYTVWEYSKDRDFSKENKLSLILKKNHIIILVQCRNDNNNIGLDNLYDFKVEAEEFLQQNKIFENYIVKLRYTMSSLLLEESTYEYIKNNPSEIDYEIIKIKK